MANGIVYNMNAKKDRPVWLILSCVLGGMLLLAIVFIIFCAATFGSDEASEQMKDVVSLKTEVSDLNEKIDAQNKRIDELEEKLKAEIARSVKQDNEAAAAEEAALNEESASDDDDKAE